MSPWPDTKGTDLKRALKDRDYWKEQAERRRAEVERLTRLLRACDERLDEFSCGADAVPPTAEVGAVPEAVGAAMMTLRRNLTALRARVSALDAAVEQHRERAESAGRQLVEKQAEVERLTRERDEARALAGQDCDGMNCPPSKKAEADAARLRAALEDAVREMRRAQSVGEVAFRTNALASNVANGLATALESARAALAGRGPSLTPREVAERVREACAKEAERLKYALTGGPDSISGRHNLTCEWVAKNVRALDLDALLGGGE